MLAIIFRPMAVWLGRKVGTSAGAGLIVLGLLLMMAFVIVATVKGVTEQMDEIGESATSAIETIAEQTEDIEVDEAALETPGRPSTTPPRPSRAVSSPGSSRASTG